MNVRVCSNTNTIRVLMATWQAYSNLTVNGDLATVSCVLSYLF